MKKYLALALLFGLAGCFEEEEVAAETPVRGLKTCLVAETERATVRRFPSVLEPTSPNVLSFEINGKLSEVSLQVGQRVSEGDILVALDPEAFEAQVTCAEASLRSAEASYENARETLDRQEQLFNSGTVTRAALDAAQTETQTRLAQFEQAETSLETAEDNLANAVLRAPFDGIVNSVEIESFATVGVGVPVVSLYSPKAFEVSFRANFDTVMLAAVRDVEATLATVPDVVLNQNDWGNKTIKVVVDIAQDRPRELGVTSSEISDVMNTYFSGTAYSTFRDGSDAIPIAARAGPSFRDSLEDLGNLSIPGDGRLVSLNQVASFRPTLEFSQFRRENQMRQIIISGKSSTLSAAEVEVILAPTLAGLDLGPAYQVTVAGEGEQSGNVNAKLAAGLPAALVIMLVALVFQFNSARRVLLTFMTIPLILVGAPLALFLTGRPPSFFVILGLISRMGIIINNAIVLIDQIDIERMGAPRDEAIVIAAKKRFSPVMLTSVTTVLGLLPMALVGGALFEPRATLMIGGLLLASPLTLIFVPAVYRVFFRWRHRCVATDVETEAAA